MPGSTGPWARHLSKDCPLSIRPFEQAAHSYISERAPNSHVNLAYLAWVVRTSLGGLNGTRI